MKNQVRQSNSVTKRDLALWSSWFVGPLAWALHQNLSYAPLDWICETGNHFVLHLVTLGALAIACAGIYIAWCSWGAGRNSPDSSARARSRRRFVAIVGVAICVTSFAGIVVESIPNFVLDACMGAT